ncbi:unnamed protein product [Enterobius vermicularis]|uniref:Small capsomere-interacting protein n=1 Tax=Enterobius vermicularis TaxID=51028 RepID=A0A0N4UX99_ENTVE|nr:unnamed protein product [Enterobius vermicularis]
MNGDNHAPAERPATIEEQERRIEFRMMYPKLCLIALDKVKEESFNKVKNYRRYVQSLNLVKSILQHLQKQRSTGGKVQFGTNW